MKYSPEEFRQLSFEKIQELTEADLEDITAEEFVILFEVLLSKYAERKGYTGVDKLNRAQLAKNILLAYLNVGFSPEETINKYCQMERSEFN